jgi:nitrogen fixation/metabolism regulation signal transduction histidine kinase
VIFFIGICLLILIISASYGFIFSKKITEPIFELVELTEKVKQGNLKIRIKKLQQ